MRRLGACLALSALAFPGCHHPDLAARKKYRALTPSTPLPASPGQAPGLHAQGDVHDTGRGAPWAARLLWQVGLHLGRGAEAWCQCQAVSPGRFSLPGGVLHCWAAPVALRPDPAHQFYKENASQAISVRPALPGIAAFLLRTEEPPVLVWHLLSCSGSRCFLWV